MTLRQFLGLKEPLSFVQYQKLCQQLLKDPAHEHFLCASDDAGYRIVYFEVITKNYWTLRQVSD